MRPIPWVLPALVLALGLVPAQTAADAEGVTLLGTLNLVEKGAPVTDAAEAVVWFVPAGGVAPPAPEDPA